MIEGVTPNLIATIFQIADVFFCDPAVVEVTAKRIHLFKHLAIPLSQTLTQNPQFITRTMLVQLQNNVVAKARQ
ncbi:Uncharacterised protein [Vibrio cholerae]|uniref:Uncharacterized protein n=1 Tax=Vibrio cholerae TaxID=666 RepID=A0A655X4E3_VIBCL|nr:Uncharacterised protein [Vibrio cholerae]